MRTKLPDDDLVATEFHSIAQLAGYRNLVDSIVLWPTLSEKS